MEDCSFCKIAKDEMDSFNVYEDEDVKAFLDVNPANKGHLLVIPKEHFENISDIPESVLAKVTNVCKQMDSLCKEKLGATGINILNASGKDAQQSVFHLHFHVVPRYKNDGLDLWFHGKSRENAEKIKETYDKLIS